MFIGFPAVLVLSSESLIMLVICSYRDILLNYPSLLPTQVCHFFKNDNIKTPHNYPFFEELNIYITSAC